MSKHKQVELDVDFIGGGRPLTKEDEIAISNYIRAYKAKHSHRQTPSKRKGLKSPRKKVAV
ncbi:MAG: hypothetical protein ABIT08_17475 [Bacteroidia bacterium]